MKDAREVSRDGEKSNEASALLVPDRPIDQADMPQLGAAEPSQRDADMPGASTLRATRNRTSKRRLIEWVAVIVFAVLVAGGLRTFVVQAFFVPSGSMLPTLQLGDRIVVVKFGYTIHRGDIVVFARPPKISAPRTKTLSSVSSACPERRSPLAATRF